MQINNNEQCIDKTGPQDKMIVNSKTFNSKRLTLFQKHIVKKATKTNTTAKPKRQHANKKE